MFHLTVLGSGSAGNCALVETERCRVLIDGGLSARQMVRRLEQCGVTPEQIDGILVTHEHGDHTSGLEVWSRQFPTPVYCNRLTAEALRRGQPEAKLDFRLFVTGSDFSIGDMAVQTFAVPHDASDPVGFVLHYEQSALGFLTDLGFATKLVYERVRAVHTLVIETNHDEKLLQNCTKRPWSVKQRIMSRHGHLSNAAAAAVLGELLGSQLRRAVLGHLSRDCNSPELAIAAVHARAAELGAAGGLEVHCSTQREVSPRMQVGERVRRWSDQLPGFEEAMRSVELPS